MPAMTEILGVLGGMGPLATVDFMGKVVALTPADGDIDHIPMVVPSDPRIPDRIAPILHGKGTPPSEALQEKAAFLQGAGATFIAMPCNTAHHWYDDIVGACSVPVLHIADAAADALGAMQLAPRKIAILATAATLVARIYHDRLAAGGFDCREPDAAVMEGMVLPGIALVKKGDLASAARLFQAAIAGQLDAGADVVLLACTEVPPALAADDPLAAYCLDATEALAQATVDWYRARKPD
jgi:aspartate racemase